MSVMVLPCKVTVTCTVPHSISSLGPWMVRLGPAEVDVPPALVLGVVGITAVSTGVAVRTG